MPYEIVACAGTPYRPSNGTEGAMFMAAFCDRCIHESEESPCDLIADSMCFDIGEPGYPTEWTHDDRGRPRCTKFHDRDLGPLPPADHPCQGFLHWAPHGIARKEAPHGSE